MSNYEIKDRKIVFEGVNSVENITISDGEKTTEKEIIKLSNVVAGIVKDTVKNKYIFVEQYRAPVDGVMVEIVAGKIDVNETPEEALKREIMEETGYKVDAMEHIFDFYTSPGRTDEICSLFYVEVSEQVNEGGGIGDEQIKIVEVSQLGSGGRLFFQDPFANLEQGVEGKIMPPYQLIDAKSLVAVCWLENSNTLKSMSEVIMQAKIKSL